MAETPDDLTGGGGSSPAVVEPEARGGGRGISLNRGRVETGTAGGEVERRRGRGGLLSFISSLPERRCGNGGGTRRRLLSERPLEGRSR